MCISEVLVDKVVTDLSGLPTSPESKVLIKLLSSKGTIYFATYLRRFQITDLPNSRVSQLFLKYLDQSGSDTQECSRPPKENDMFSRTRKMSTCQNAVIRVEGGFVDMASCY